MSPTRRAHSTPVPREIDGGARAMNRTCGLILRLYSTTAFATRIGSFGCQVWVAGGSSPVRSRCRRPAGPAGLPYSCRPGVPCPGHWSRSWETAFRQANSVAANLGAPVIEKIFTHLGLPLDMRCRRPDPPDRSASRPPRAQNRGAGGPSPLSFRAEAQRPRDSKGPPIRPSDGCAWPGSLAPFGRRRSRELQSEPGLTSPRCRKQRSGRAVMSHPRGPSGRYQASLGSAQRTLPAFQALSSVS